MVKRSEWKRETKSYLKIVGATHERLSDDEVRPVSQTLFDIAHLAVAPLVLLGALATPLEDD